MLTKKLKNLLSFIFFVIGIVLLIVLIHKVGWQEVIGSIQKLKFKILYIFAFPISWYVIQSFAWWRVLSDDGIKVSFIHVLLVKLTGEAINTVTPVSFIGGDPYRFYMLQKKVPRTNSAASVVIDRTMYMLGVFLLLFTTFLIAWFVLPLPGLWRIFFPVFTFGFFLIFVLLIIVQKRGMFSLISRLIQRLGIFKGRLTELSNKFEHLDDQIGAFYNKHKAHFFEIMVLQFIGRFLGVVEIFIIVSLLDLPITFVQCFFLASLTILINIVFVFIPGSMGVMESGYGALFYLLKLNPAYGVAIQLIRRIRTFFWIAIGLLIILFYKPKETTSISPS